MANSVPSASIYGMGAQVSNGYPVYLSMDSTGTGVAPFGSYVWNPNGGSSGLWVPWPVDSNGNPQMSLTGSKVNLRWIDASSGTTVNAGNSEQINITASTGKIARIIGMILTAQPPSGATSGTHVFEFSSKQLGLGSWGSQTYSTAIRFQYGYWWSAQTTLPSDVAAVAEIVSRLEFSDTTPLVVKYQNITDANQTTARTIQVLVEERAYVS